MNYALLIDSENAKPELDGIFEEISKYGDTPIRYIIGDFTNKAMSHWISICQRHAITCIQTINFTGGKNSLDISLVIEGMKILYEKPYIDGIIIVASDSDYTPLCRQWRIMGKDVIGIGRSDSPESYRASCTKFIYTENIFAKDKTKNAISISKIKAFVFSLLNSYNGKCQMSHICESLIQAYPDFDVRSYGYTKSIDFFRNEFDEIDITEDIKNTYFITLKDKEVKDTILPKKPKVEPKKKVIKSKKVSQTKLVKKPTKAKMKAPKVIREEIEDKIDL